MMKNLFQGFVRLIVVMFFATPAVGYSSTSKEKVQEERDTKKRTNKNTSESNANLILVWGGTGVGTQFTHRMRGNVSIGGHFSYTQGENCSYTSIGGDYEYRIECLTSASNFLLQSTWLSSGTDGFLLGAGIGATHSKATINGSRTKLERFIEVSSISISESVSSMGLSFGAQAGYIFGFQNGLTIGLIGSFISTNSKMANFSRPREGVAEDNDAFSSIDFQKNNLSPSTIGLAFGFAF